MGDGLEGWSISLSNTAGNTESTGMWFLANTGVYTTAILGGLSEGAANITSILDVPTTSTAIIDNYHRYNDMGLGFYSATMLQFNPAVGLFEAYDGVSYQAGDFGDKLSAGERAYRGGMSALSTVGTALGGVAGLRGVLGVSQISSFSQAYSAGAARVSQATAAVRGLVAPRSTGRSIDGFVSVEQLEASALRLRRPDIADTFANGTATRVVLDESLTVGRIHGGKTGSIGRFLSADQFSSRAVARQQLAMKQEWGNAFTKKTDVTLPPGTVVWRGTVGRQVQKNGKVLRGGADQIWVESPLDPRWFKNTRHFKN